jgi:hypothetical protein
MSDVVRVRLPWIRADLEKTHLFAELLRLDDALPEQTL